MSETKSREGQAETSSGAQRDPDERVRKALLWADSLDWKMPEFQVIVDELRRLQAAQREPVAEMVGVPDGMGTVIVEFYGERPPAGTKLYTQAQRDDHPPEGTPDFISPVSSPDQPLPPPSAVASVADRKDAARQHNWHGYGDMMRCLKCVAFYHDNPPPECPKDAPWLCSWARFRYRQRDSEGWTYTDDDHDARTKRAALWNVEERAMSADVRSQATDTQGREPLVSDDQDEIDDGDYQAERGSRW